MPAADPEPGVSLKDEKLLPAEVPRQPLLLPELALGPLLEAPCPPHHLTSPVTMETLLRLQLC